MCIFRFAIKELGKVEFYEFRLFLQNQKMNFFIDVFTPGGVIKMCKINQNIFICTLQKTNIHQNKKIYIHQHTYTYTYPITRM